MIADNILIIDPDPESEALLRHCIQPWQNYIAYLQSRPGPYKSDRMVRHLRLYFKGRWTDDEPKQIQFDTAADVTYFLLRWS